MKSLSLFLTLVILISCSGDGTKKTGLEGKPIPSFNLLLMDSTTRLNTKDIVTKQPIVFFFLSPYCPYCRAQTEEIISDIKLVSNIQFYIISSLPFQDLKQYSEHFQLNKFSNVTIGYDYDFFFAKYFSVESVPYIAIYNENKLLNRVIAGKVGIKTIRQIAFD